MSRPKRRIHDDDDDGSDLSRFSDSETDDDEEEENGEEEDVPAIGDVGYQFRKQFSTGWFTGAVKAIVQNSEGKLVFCLFPCESIKLCVAPIPPPD